MEQYKIEDLLDRYLKRETSHEEDKVVEKWLQVNENNDSEWQKLDSKGKDLWLSELLVDIKLKTQINNPILVERKQRMHLWYKIASVAAVLVILIGIYFGWPVDQSKLSPSELTTISVSEHQKKHIVLPDGSQVWLNAGTELRYPATFNESNREIYLSGEAYFDIAHDANKPFLIHTSSVLTTVLGTAFNIKEDKAIHTVEVTVARGKVRVSGKGKTLSTLTANQQVSVDVRNNKSIEKMVDVHPVIAWQEVMSFDDVTFGEATIQLQRSFNVNIAFTNERLKNCRFSGSALSGDDLHKILRVICAFNNATWQTMPDGSILIDGQGCN